MRKIIVAKKSWSDIDLHLKELNPDFYQIVKNTAKEVSDPYVYELTVPYYMDIIDKGSAGMFNRDVLEGEKSTIEAMMSDFAAQSNQPLSFVLEGLVEIYNSNSYVYNNFGDFEYTYPLRLFKEGQLFGTFEVMDYLSAYPYATYSYSASSGHHSIYPLLPDPEKGSKKYQHRIGAKYLERFKMSSSVSKPNYTILDVFPLMLEELAPLMSYQTKILVFPSFWHKEEGVQKNLLNDYVKKQAWIQVQTKNEVEANLFQKQKRIKGMDTQLPLTKALYLNYLNLAKKGVSPLLKFHNQVAYPYLEELNELLSHLVEGLYPPVLLVYDYLYPDGQKGIIPTVTFPFETSAFDRVKNAGEFINQIGILLKRDDPEFWLEIATGTYKHSWKLNEIPPEENSILTAEQELYPESMEMLNISAFLKQKFSDRVVFSQNIFTKCIIEMAY